MEIRADIALKAIIKSYTEVILPAIDSDNRMAQEQAQLILGLLTLVREQLPLQYHYDRDELQSLLAVAADLQGDFNILPLSNEITYSEKIQAAAGVTPEELVSAISRLRNAIADQVDAATSQPESVKRAVHRKVLKAGRKQQLRERSWLLMQGWEVEPETVPPIETLIDFHPLFKDGL